MISAEFDAGVLGDDVSAERHCEILEFGDPSVPEAGRAHHHRLHGLVHVAADEQLQRRAVDVLGDDHERTVRALGHLEGRHDLLHLGDLLVGQQDQRVLQHGLHALVVGDHVAGRVAVAEFDAVDDVEGQPRRVALLRGDHTRDTDVIDGAGDDVADRLVVAGGERGDAMQVLAPADLHAVFAQRLDDDGNGALDTAPHPHRVGAGVDGPQPFPDHRLGQDGRGGGAVTDHAVGLHRDFLDQLRAHVGERIAELDLPGDRHAVVGDRRGAGQLLQDGVAPLRAERHLDRVGEGVDAGSRRSRASELNRSSLAMAVCPFVEGCFGERRSGREDRGCHREMTTFKAS